MSHQVEETDQGENDVFTEITNERSFKVVALSFGRRRKI